MLSKRYQSIEVDHNTSQHVLSCTYGLSAVAYTKYKVKTSTKTDTKV